MNRLAKEFMNFTKILTKPPKQIALYPTEDNFVKKMKDINKQDDFNKPRNTRTKSGKDF
jgi:hypothetical protein